MKTTPNTILFLVQLRYFSVGVLKYVGCRSRKPSQRRGGEIANQRFYKIRKAFAEKKSGRTE